MRRPRFKAPPGRSRYRRNRFGGVVWRRDDRAHAQTPTAVTTEDNHYLYDGTNQIKERKRGNLAGTPPNYTGIDPIQQQENWTYDASGNWTRYSNPSTAPGHTQDRKHNDGNELWKISVSGLGEVWPIYDSAGNMRTLSKAPGVSTDQYTLKWDAWNRLVEVKDGSTVVASYTYDGLNRRLTKTAGSETRHYYYDTQWRPLEERVGSSTTPDRQYTWGVRDRWDLLRRKRSTTNPLDETLYVLRDYLDPVAIADAAGNVVERYAYDAFGNVRFLDQNYGSRTNSSYAWDFLFHAEFRDPETKLYNYGHRYYDTGLGRWLSRDPIGERGGGNLYGFVGNDSVNKLDELGLWWWDDDIIEKGILPLFGFTKGNQTVGDAWSAFGAGYHQGAVNVVTAPFRLGNYAAEQGIAAHDLALQTGSSDFWAFTLATGVIVTRATGALDLIEATAGGQMIVGDSDSGLWMQDFSSGWERSLHGTAGALQLFGTATTGAAGITRLSTVPRFYRGAGLVPRAGGPGSELLSEYRRFRSQGHTPARAKYLTEPYDGIGHHFIYDSVLRERGTFLRWFMDSPFNLTLGRNMSRGRFYEYHARLHFTPKFGIGSTAHNWGFPSNVGGGRWYYRNVLDRPEPWGAVGYMWHGSPFELKAAIGAGGAVSGYVIWTSSQ